MGKVEKELAKSYWHARDIAIAQFPEQRKHSRYEAAYLFMNNEITIKDSKYNDDAIYMIIRNDPRLMENPVFFEQISGKLLAKMYHGNTDVILSGLRKTILSAREKLTPEYLNNMDDERISGFLVESKKRNVFDLFKPERLKAIKGGALAEIILSKPNSHKKFNLDNLDGDGMLRIITNYTLNHYNPKKVIELISMMNFDRLSEENIIQLLRYDHRFIDRVDVSKLQNPEWIEKLLWKSPHLIKYFKDRI